MLANDARKIKKKTVYKQNKTNVAVCKKKQKCCHKMLLHCY